MSAGRVFCSVSLLFWLGVPTSLLAQNLTTLAQFSYATGTEPDGELVMDAAGNLYGTAQYGGAYGDGTVFEITARTHSLKTLFSFDGSDGSNPNGALVFNSSGALCGTTVHGGADNDGTVFEFNPVSSALNTVATFDGTDGQWATGSLTIDSAGNLYGVTERGGQNNYGTVFEIPNGTQDVSTLCSFQFLAGGAYPNGGLVLDKSGNLYGTTSFNGSLFEVDPSTKTLSILTGFQGNGSYSPVIMGPGGNLYGTVYTGSIDGLSDGGSVFEYSLSSKTLTTLGTFPYFFGPEGVLLLDKSGDIWGTTTQGGPGEYGGPEGNYGSVYELDPETKMLVEVAYLPQNDNDPMAGLISDSSGNLYGTAVGPDGGVYELSNAGFVPLPEPGSVWLVAGVGAGFLLLSRRRGAGAGGPVGPEQ